MKKIILLFLSFVVFIGIMLGKDKVSRKYYLAK